jgi:hypothetical protein
MVRRAPQVVVKLVRAPKGMKGISNNLTYISRDGKLEIEDQDGQVIIGKDAVADLKAEWRDGGMPIAADSTMRDAFHLVLSMPTRTDPLSVQRAARDFATREFSGIQYAMVLHTFETDPGPEDRTLTTRLREAGDLLGIRLLDHLILGDERLYSSADQGWPL